MQCEKAKKVLSTIDVAPIDMVNVANDLDVQVKISLEEFEERCKSLGTALTALLSTVISLAKVEAADIHSIELVVRAEVHASISEHTHHHHHHQQLASKQWGEPGEGGREGEHGNDVDCPPYDSWLLFRLRCLGAVNPVGSKSSK